MGDKSKIQWTDATWNPIRGCSHVSAGCKNCYAERQAARFSGYKFQYPEDGEPLDPLPFRGFVDRSTKKWTGRVELIPSKLEEPLHWKKPRRVFVNSMSDLFHEALPDEAIDNVFAVMALCPQHTFQVLTKRPERMLDYCTGPELLARIGWLCGLWAAKRNPETIIAGDEITSDWAKGKGWPLPNVWEGVSCENQQTADERLPLLLQTPAAVRFVSLEPLLMPVDLTQMEGALWHFADGQRWPVKGWPEERAGGVERHGGIDWVIVGGESGPGARPCDLAWIRSVVQQCKVAGVPVFCKQLGSVWAKENGGDCKGGDLSVWPPDLKVREFPNA